MLYVSLVNGSTEKFDLLDENDNKRWKTCIKNYNFHRSIRSIALSTCQHRCDVPLPKRFKSVRYNAEILRDRQNVVCCEKIIAYVDDVVITLNMFLKGREGRFRLDIDRIGKLRYFPVP